MKNFLASCLILGFLVLASFLNQANEGCLDNQNRSKKDKPNYQNYRNVVCMCNCERYAWSPDRCCCQNCKHYHDPVGNFAIKRKWEK